jgi:hypothetical protein
LVRQGVGGNELLFGHGGNPSLTGLCGVVAPSTFTRKKTCLRSRCAMTEQGRRAETPMPVATMMTAQDINACRHLSRSIVRASGHRRSLALPNGSPRAGRPSACR